MNLRSFFLVFSLLNIVASIARAELEGMPEERKGVIQNFKDRMGENVSLQFVGPVPIAFGEVVSKYRGIIVGAHLGGTIFGLYAGMKGGVEITEKYRISLLVGGAGMAYGFLQSGYVDAKLQYVFGDSGHFIRAGVARAAYKSNEGGVGPFKYATLPTLEYGFQHKFF